MLFGGLHTKFRQSLALLKRPSSLTKLALLSALYVIIHLFFTIPLTGFLQIRFSFLSVVLAGAMFGPLGGALVGVVGDLLSFFLRPTGNFFPGFTLNALITGVCYGAVLYRVWEQPLFRTRLLRVVTAKLLVILVVELLLTPLWLSMLYGEAYLLILQTRLLKTLLFAPLDILMMLALLRILPKNFKQ